MVDDLRPLAEWLAARPEVDERRVAARGSSMGGLMAIHAGAASDRVAAVVAICPAAESMLPRTCGASPTGGPRPRGSALAEMRIDAPALAGWLETSDVGEAVQRMGAKPLLIIHARGDEVVPYTHSEKLYELAAEPKRLLLLEGGDHRSAQHDAELQGESLRWLTRDVNAATARVCATSGLGRSGWRRSFEQAHRGRRPCDGRRSGRLRRQAARPAADDRDPRRSRQPSARGSPPAAS